MRLALHRNCVTGEERVLALKAMRKDHLVKKRQVVVVVLVVVVVVVVVLVVAIMRQHGEG